MPSSSATSYILSSVIDSAVSCGILILSARIFNISTKYIRFFLYQAISALIVNPAVTGILFVLIIKIMYVASYESWLYL